MKDILKKHYEKAILAALALGFVMALLYLMQMLESANNVTESDLKFNAPRTKYEVKNFKSVDYNITHKLGEITVWDERKDNDKSGFTAELLVPMKSLRCSHKECKKIIPWVMAQKRERICPHCERELPDPGEPKDYASEIARRDSDGDGMPDRYERRMGFKLDDPKDAEEDLDGDGFSNLYEFLVGTDPSDVSSYPDLGKCLCLLSMRRQRMPVKLTQVSAIPDPADKNSKRRWEIDLEINGQQERRTIGSTFKTRNGAEYKIVDAIRVTGDQREGSVVLNDDRSRLIISPVVNNKVDEKVKIELVTGKNAYELEPRVVICDIRIPKGKKGRLHFVRKGETFEVKAQDGHSVKFIVKATDVAKETVTIEDMETGEAVLLTKQTRIPKNAYVKNTDGENEEKNTRRRRPRRNRRR